MHFGLKISSTWVNVEPKVVAQFIPWRMLTQLLCPLLSNELLYYTLANSTITRPPEKGDGVYSF